MNLSKVYWYLLIGMIVGFFIGIILSPFKWLLAIITLIFLIVLLLRGGYKDHDEDHDEKHSNL